MVSHDFIIFQLLIVYVNFSIGRRPAFFIYLLIECFFGIATAFANNYITWTLFRFGVGFTVPAILGTPFVLGELTFTSTSNYDTSEQKKK